MGFQGFQFSLGRKRIQFFFNQFFGLQIPIELCCIADGTEDQEHPKSDQYRYPYLPFHDRKTEDKAADPKGEYKTKDSFNRSKEDFKDQSPVPREAVQMGVSLPISTMEI